VKVLLAYSTVGNKLESKLEDSLVKETIESVATAVIVEQRVTALVFRMRSLSLLLPLLSLQIVPTVSFINIIKPGTRSPVQPLYANPLFFGGKRLPVKEEQGKPKESLIKKEADRKSNDDDDDDVSNLVKIHDEERLQKVIARAGLASRREAEKMVTKIYAHFVRVHIIRLIVIPSLYADIGWKSCCEWKTHLRTRSESESQEGYNSCGRKESRPSRFKEHFLDSRQ
jgi:ribosomal protein S4